MTTDGIVLDTNVLISAALSTDTPPARVTLWAIDHTRIIFCDESFEELRSRIWRAKFDPYLSVERRRRLLHDFRAIADWVDIAETSTPLACRDPDDEIFLRAAVAGSARWLVSGDADLLALPRIPLLSVVSPRDFLARIAG